RTSNPSAPFASTPHGTATRPALNRKDESRSDSPSRRASADLARAAAIESAGAGWSRRYFGSSHELPGDGALHPEPRDVAATSRTLADSSAGAEHLARLCGVCA